MSKKRNWKDVILLLLMTGLFFGLETVTARAWGTLDMTFGNAGVYTDTKPNSYPNSVLVQPDGKILVTGHTSSNGRRRLMLRRWMTNGRIDTTFGNDGMAVVDAPNNANIDYVGWRMTMLSGDKIAVVGQAEYDICVWVINSNGFADTSFGTNGLKIMKDYHYAYGQIGARGAKIILGVYHKNYKRVIIHQLNADGSNDATFGSEGRSYTGIFHNSIVSPGYEMITGQSQNKITIVGISNHPQYGTIKRIERVNQDGYIDFTFTPTQTPIPFGGYITGSAALSGGDFIYSDLQSVSVDFDAKLYKIDWNGTNVLTNPIADGTELIAVQNSGNPIVANGFGDHIDRHDTMFNFLDAAPTGYGTTYNVGATQPDNKVVFATNVDAKLTLFRWLKN